MDEDAPQAAISGPDTRSLEERLVDKNWKTRLAAFEELNRNFKTCVNNDPIFEEYGHFLSKMSLDSNASALDAGLDVILTFIENASVSLIRSYTERLCANVFEKAIGARVTTVTRGRTIVLKLMEMDDPILCTTTMLGLLADKKPKIPPTCLELIKEGVLLFGARTFPIKDIITHMPAVLNGSNAPAREAAMTLMVEISRWIGRAPFNTLLENIRVAQKSDFERMVAERENEGTPVPTLYLKKDREKATAATDPSASSAGAGAGKGGAPRGNASAESDAREFIEEVDLMKRLRATEYATLIAEEKWNDQLRALQFVIDILGPTPKVKSGSDVHEVVTVCNAFLRQGHLQLQVASLKILSLLADGLRGEFGPLLRSVSQNVILKVKEKRLSGEVQNVLVTGVRHCFAFESVCEDTVEVIRNKKSPPHARCALMEFVSTLLHDFPEKIQSVDSLKAIAEALIASCEDSDPKVRDTCSTTLCDLAPIVKSRGKQASDVNRLLMGLETSAPRVFKKMQAIKEGTSSTTVEPVKSVATASSAPPVVVKEVQTKSSLPPKAPAAKSAARPATGGSKKASTAATDESADDNVDAVAMEVEEAKEKLTVLQIEGFDGPFQEQIKSANWQIKVDALGAMGQAIQSKQMGGQMSAPLVAYIRSVTTGFKITNVSVQKAVIQLFVTAAENAGSAKFSKAAAAEVLSVFSDKLSDKKLSDTLLSLMTSFSEVTAPGFVFKRINQLMDKIKAPAAHQVFLEWIKNAVTEFGAHMFPVQVIGNFCLAEMDNKVAGVRTAAVEVMGAFFHQLGPRFQSIAITDDMKPALRNLVEAEFTKVGHDPNAASKTSRGIKGEEGASVASVGGAIPRMDLGSALDRSVVGDLVATEGKDSWQTRKAAMESIIATCERSGHFIEGNKAAGEVVKSLKLRLSDTQANLKPIAAVCIGHMLASLDLDACTKMLKVVGGPLLASVGDNKKAMRDAAISSLQMIITLNKGEEAICEPSLFFIILPSITESLTNPIGRQELVTWIQSHISGNANLKGAVSEYGELVVSLVGVMQDKLASVRLLGEQAIASLLAKGYISKAIVDKAVRDLPPATLRGMQAAIDRIYSAAPTRSNSITSKANESASLAVSAPSVKAEAIAPTKSDARGEVAPPPPTAAKSRHHHTDEPPVSTTLKKSVSNDLTMSGIYENGGGGVANSSAGNVIKKTNKARRVEECARIKWPQPPEEPGEAEFAMLKSTWEPLLAPEIFALLFPESRHGALSQESYIGGAHELVSLLNGEVIGATSGLKYNDSVANIALQHTDLMLRWAALILAQRESSKGLLEIILLVATIFKKLNSCDWQLSEWEISTILPALIDKSGHNSSRHRSAFKIAVDASRSVVAPSRLCQLLLHGLNCKNKKTRVVCIEEIDRLVDDYGPQTLGKPGIREIGNTLESKDTDVSGRSACLDLCYTLYMCLGNDMGKLLKLLGEISERTIPMIEHRVKERKRNGAAGATSSSSTVDDNPTTAANSDTQEDAVVDSRESRESRSQGPTEQQKSYLNTALPLPPPSNVGYTEAISHAPSSAPFVLQLTPMEETRSVSYTTKEKEAKVNPFRLVMSPDDISAGTNAGVSAGANISMKSSAQSATVAPAAPVYTAQSVVAEKKPSAPEVDGVYVDIISKVDRLLAYSNPTTTVTATEEYAAASVEAKNYLKMLYCIFTEQWTTYHLVEDNVMLVKHIAVLTTKLIRCFKHGMACRLQDAVCPSGIDAGLISITLACLYAVINRKDLASSLSDDIISSLTEELTRQLVSEHFAEFANTNCVDPNPARGATESVFQGINGLLLQIAAGGNIRTGSLICSFIDVLELCIAELTPSSRPPLPSMCSKPLSKLLLKVLADENNRDNAYRMPNVDSFRVISILHHFFNIHPPTCPRDDLPYRCAKTVLSQLVTHLELDEVLRVCQILKIMPNSFIYRLAIRLSNSNTSSNDAKASAVNAIAEDDVDDGVSAEIISIIDSITTARDKQVPIRELHMFLKHHPRVKVDKYLLRISSTFRKFVVDMLQKLEAESSSDQATTQSTSQSTADAPPGGGSEALRILEGLKTRPKMRTNSMISNTPTKEGDKEGMRERDTSTGQRPYVASPRASIHDKIRGTLNSITASLSLDGGGIGGSTTGAGGGAGSSGADSDLMSRLNRLKKLESSKQQQQQQLNQVQNVPGNMDNESI